MADEAEKLENIQKLRKHLNFQPLRFIHIFLTIVLTLYGTGIFLATITVKSQLSDYLPFLHYYLGNPVIVLILGSLVLICIGCLGVITSSQSLYQGIVTCGVLLFGLFMFKLTMAVVFIAVVNSADKSITEALESHMNNYTEYTGAIDHIQTNLSCCGVSDFTDWNSTLGYIPGSCCNSDKACGFADILSLNETGCYVALKDLIFYFINYLVIILGALAVLEVMAMVITFFLARRMADYRRRISRNIIREGADCRIANNPITARNPLGNAVGPFQGNRFDNEETHPAVAGGVRKSIVRNPIYRDVSFSRGKNSRQKIVPTVPRLPRVHKRSHVGY